ncbi:uncharacterized protein N7459_004893 [Penicillium hispanicum]|uniref:uncharacterized protein n=1 Tax=Penicillium hispanicum TaxID=1080232 RepID=UPI002541F8CB|nr:uncharacterized protein N7459_004893 [Penicillium hispanicum]KAJ5585093.1 hypothetical protein N7459_004893 [Penicillium hispanicum]
MQSFLEQRRIYKQLQRQILVKHEPPDDVWTHERRYYYRDGRIDSDPRDPEGGEPEHRRREHGQRAPYSGPVLEPRHTARSHLHHQGDVERADYVPEFQADPFTINTRDTLGDRVDIMLTGVERNRPEDDRGMTDEADGTHDAVMTDGESKYKDELIIVTYEGDTDPMDPHNWSFASRAATTTLLSLLGAVILWSSTIDISALNETMHLFHTDFEIETLPTAFFLICLGIGGLIAAPISELVGRNPVYIACLPPFMLFNMGAGLSKNVVQRIVCRALTGLFGSAPLVVSAAALVDIWSLIERIYAFPFYAIITFLGAVMGPVVGSIITWVSAVSWSFVDWTTIIISGILLTLVVFFLPETYSPVLLRWKANQIRRLTGDKRYRAPSEFHRASLSRRLTHALYRPFILFFAEPIIMIFSGYLSIIFIILYTLSAGYESIFSKKYKLNEGQTGAAFLGLVIGVLLSTPLVPLAMRLVRRDIYHARGRGQLRPDPEVNLYLALFGAPLLPISLFWMGWTSRPSIPMWCPLGASVVFAMSVLSIFVSSYQYVASAFESHPASALASLQLFRFVAAAVMAIIAEIMYHNLGVNWTLTTLGLVATAFLPVPYLLYIWGDVVRRWSRRALSEDD